MSLNVKDYVMSPVDHTCVRNLYFLSYRFHAIFTFNAYPCSCHDLTLRRFLDICLYTILLHLVITFIINCQSVVTNIVSVCLVITFKNISQSTILIFINDFGLSFCYWF